MRKRDGSPSPGWERGRGEGRTIQNQALTVPLTTGCALFGDGLPSPLTLSHSGEGDLSRFRAPWSILRDAADAAPQDEVGGKGQPPQNEAVGYEPVRASFRAADSPAPPPRAGREKTDSCP